MVAATRGDRVQARPQPGYGVTMFGFEVSRQSVTRTFLRLSVVLSLALIWVFASWLNTYRFHLIVGATDVEVHRGLWLPVGHRGFVPDREELRAAYRPLRIPDGFPIARGRRMYFDRVQLDQALHQIYHDITSYALEPLPDQRRARNPDLADRSLQQLSRLPGLTLRQRQRVEQLGALLAYYRGVSDLARVVTGLERACASFLGSAGAPRVPRDAERWGLRAARALEVLAGFGRATDTGGSAPELCPAGLTPKDALRDAPPRSRRPLDRDAEEQGAPTGTSTVSPRVSRPSQTR